MSYDLFIYSRHNAPVQRGVLRDALKQRGWEVRILESDSFLGSEPLVLLPDDGVLDDSLLAGWRVGQKNSGLLHEMFKAGNGATLTELFTQEYAFATCGLDVTFPFVYNPDDLEYESEDELRRIVGDTVVDYRKDAKVLYYLRLSGMSIVTASDFTHDVWHTIGALGDGLLDDPQRGAFYWISPAHKLVRADGFWQKIKAKIRRQR